MYNELGYGFLETVYRGALAVELSSRGRTVQREVATSVWYRGTEVGHYRADLVVDDKVIIETKASEAITDADRKQLLNYLRCTHHEVGLLLHFGPKAAFHRFVYSNALKRP